MRRPLFSLLLLLLLLPLGLGLLLLFALEPVPKIKATGSLTHQDIERARQIIAQHNPYRLKAGALQRLVLSEKDLTLAANYLIKNTGAGEGGAVIRLRPGRLHLKATVRLPESPAGDYINIQLTIAEEQGKTRVSELYIGSVPVPGPLADFVLVEMMRYLLHTEERVLIEETIKRLSFLHGTMQILYRWQPEWITRIKSRLIPPQERARIRSYYSKMAELTRQPGLRQRVSLMYIMRPLFAYARQRSENSDPVAENRAALVVLAAYVMPRVFSALMPEVSDLPRPRRFVLTLNRRKDFVEHFVGSAALAATGDARLADAVGLYKEVADSKRRSGFSFTDLAADRAGTRFGEIATASPGQARRVQQLVASGAREEDLMPSVHDLPENMTAEAFRLRFNRIGSPAFNALRQQIEQRIAACRLYREAG